MEVFVLPYIYRVRRASAAAEDRQRPAMPEGNTEGASADDTSLADPRPPEPAADRGEQRRAQVNAGRANREELEGLKVSELRARLRDAGEPVGGSKAELIDRVVESGA